MFCLFSDSLPNYKNDTLTFALILSPDLVPMVPASPAPRCARRAGATDTHSRAHGPWPPTHIQADAHSSSLSFPRVQAVSICHLLFSVVQERWWVAIHVAKPGISYTDVKEIFFGLACKVGSCIDGKW